MSDERMSEFPALVHTLISNFRMSASRILTLQTFVVLLSLNGKLFVDK